MTLLHVLNYITWAISISALVYVVYLAAPLVKAAWLVAKAEAEEEQRLKKATELLEAVTEADEERKAA